MWLQQSGDDLALRAVGCATRFDTPLTTVQGLAYLLIEAASRHRHL